MRKRLAALKDKIKKAATIGRTHELSAEAVEQIRQDLLRKREDLLQLVARKKERELPEVEVGDEADVANQSIEKEILFDVTDQEQMVLEKVEAALRKLDAGGFGICESCQKPIPSLRLKAMPWARYCMPCQARNDR